MKIAILGVGNRGLHYGELASERSDVEFTAFCDLESEKLNKARKTLHSENALVFTDDEKFFAQGKLADILFICTQDRAHYRHAMRALELGYDILLEKPVSPNIQECIDIEKYAAETGRHVFVCHVLRYSAYYKKIKEVVESGVLGKIIQINHEENVGYWHFAHSYVRGNWRRECDSTPMLMAKCCHYMDLLYWLSDSRCK